MSKLRELIVTVTTALGASESKMRWRLQKLENWSRRSKAKAESKAQRVKYAHKKCRGCRALCDSDDTVCSNCGDPLDSKLTHMVSRAGLGGLATTSALLIALMVATYGVAMASAFGSFELRHLIVEAKAGGAFAGEVSYRLLAVPFVQVSMLGLLVGGLVIFLVGQEIESFYGRFVMPLGFMLTSMIGTALHLALFDSVLFGSQTGICGLLGIGIAAGHKLGSHRGRELRNFTLKWAVGVLAGTLLLQGNIVGNVVALGAGALLGGVGSPDSFRLSRWRQRTLGLIGLGLALGGAAIAIATLSVGSLWDGY